MFQCLTGGEVAALLSKNSRWFLWAQLVHKFTFHPDVATLSVTKRRAWCCHATRWNFLKATAAPKWKRGDVVSWRFLQQCLRRVLLLWLEAKPVFNPQLSDPGLRM